MQESPRWRSPAAVPALTMLATLAMLMAHSMVMVRWGASWQLAVAVPVSLAVAAVQLVRLVAVPDRVGVGKVARRAIRSVTFADSAERGRSEEPLT